NTGGDLTGHSISGAHLCVRPRCGGDGPTAPYAARGLWVFLESGSSASGRRRSLRFNALELNLAQVQNLREVGKADT
ncbi:MAG: hypothetical protein WBB65_10110, partial [Anaerolineales bacterium]